MLKITVQLTSRGSNEINFMLVTSNGTVSSKEGDSIVVYGYKNALNLRGSLSGSINFIKSEAEFKSSLANPRVNFYENQELVVRKASTKEVKEIGGKEAQCALRSFAAYRQTSRVRINQTIASLLNNNLEIRTTK